MGAEHATRTDGASVELTDHDYIERDETGNDRASQVRSVRDTIGLARALPAPACAALVTQRQPARVSALTEELLALDAGDLVRNLPRERVLRQACLRLLASGTVTLLYTDSPSHHSCPQIGALFLVHAATCKLSLFGSADTFCQTN